MTQKEHYLDLATWTTVVGLCMREIARSGPSWPVLDRIEQIGGRLFIIVGLFARLTIEWLS